MADSYEPEKIRALQRVSRQLALTPRPVLVQYLPGQEHVADARAGEVVDVWGPGPLNDLQIHRVEDRADELPLWAGDKSPEERLRLDNVQPFRSCLQRV
jgi:hypothetical protein